MRKIEPKDRIIVALDVDDIAKAKVLVEALNQHVGGFKIGLELIYSMFAQLTTSNIRKAIRALKEIRQLFEMLSDQVFLDGKLNDIPNTINGAVGGIIQQSVKMFNIHCLSGRKALEKAYEASQYFTGNSRPLVLGVTILTSLDYRDFCQMGFFSKSFNFANKEEEQKQVQYLVKELALMAQDAGLDGVVCSPQEIEMLRSWCQPEFLIVTPGVRPEWAATNDQKRVMTPAEAIKAGADYLVIGRPITNPPAEIGSPIEAAKRIIEEITSVL